MTPAASSASTSPSTTDTIDQTAMAIDAVIFDLDGVLLDSEPVWEDVRRRFAVAHGGRWDADTQRAMMGMSSGEWARFMRTRLGVALTEPDIVAGVVDGMAARYRDGVPLLPGAVDAVRRLAARWPIGLASSANRQLIDLVLATARLDAYFAITVSSEEVPRGKPAPDVYLEVSRRLGVAPPQCTAIEDSTNGLLAAEAAGMRVIAVPRAGYPPKPEALAQADAVIPDLGSLSVEVVDPARTG
jgi:HAD superfamily hydrolase (TIGR01509 family)